MPAIFTDRDGLRFILYPNHNPGVYIKNGGNYELAEVQICRNLISEGMIVFDVGANIGVYSLLFAKLVGAKGRVHSFEPEESNFRRLVDNLSLNPELNVAVNFCAVSDKGGKIPLNVFDDSFNSWHSTGELRLPDPYNPGKFVEPIKQVHVECTTLDDYCSAHKISHIDYLKIDVEGAELNVLKGATKLLESKSIQYIQFEISKPQVEGMRLNGSEILRFLRDKHYRVSIIESDGSLNEKIDLNLVHYSNFIAQAGA